MIHASTRRHVCGVDLSLMMRARNKEGN